VQAISDDNFHVGFNNIYDKNLARSLRNISKKHAHLFKGLEDKYDLDLAANCTSIRGFDDAITRRTFGRKLSLQYAVAGSHILCPMMLQNQCRSLNTVTSVYAVISAVAAAQHVVCHDQHAPACMAACDVSQLSRAHTYKVQHSLAATRCRDECQLYVTCCGVFTRGLFPVIIMSHGQDLPR